MPNCISDNNFAGNRVTDKTYSRNTKSSAEAINMRLNENTQKLGTNHNYDTFTSCGSNVGQIKALQDDLNFRSQQTKNNIAIAKSRLDMQAVNMRAISEIASDLRVKLGINIEDASLQQYCTQQLTEVQRLLNCTDTDGRYLFGGQNTNTPPCNINNLPNVINLGTPISYAYNNASSNLINAQITSTQTIQFGVTTENSGFAELLNALQIGSITPWSNDPANVNYQIFQMARNYASQATMDIPDAISTVDCTLSQIESMHEQLTHHIDRINAQYNDLAGVNQIEVYQKISEDQINLELLFKVENRIGLDWLLDLMNRR